MSRNFELLRKAGQDHELFRTDGHASATSDSVRTPSFLDASTGGRPDDARPLETPQLEELFGEAPGQTISRSGSRAVGQDPDVLGPTREEDGKLVQRGCFTP